MLVLFFFFNDPPTPEIYTLSLHDALPIYPPRGTVGVQPGSTNQNNGGLSFEITPTDAEVVVDGRVVGTVSQFTPTSQPRSEEHTSELQSLTNLVCRLLLEKKKKKKTTEQT